MKPAPFEYHDPRSLTDALEILAEWGDDAKVLAGGQSLVPLLNMRLARADHLVDILRLAELSGVETNDGATVIGAITPQYVIDESREIAEAQPLLAEAIQFVGHPQTRNRGTVGGSLAHADPAAELPAVAMALRATLEVMNKDRTRVVGADDFFVTYFTTAVEPDELLTRVVLPPWPPRTGHAFLEVSRRHGDFAMVGVAAVLGLDEGGVIERVDLVFLGCGEIPVRARRAEELLLGERRSDEVFKAAAAAARDELDPPSDIHASAWYRRTVAESLTERALSVAVDRAMERADAGA